MNKDDWSAFAYFVNEYMNNINGGGSFNTIQLVDLFKKYEHQQLYQKLSFEAIGLITEIQKEDWEIDKQFYEFCFYNIGGKNAAKSLIKLLIQQTQSA